jgi:hypothetical protein
MKRMTEFGKANDGKVLIPVIHLELFVSFISFFAIYMQILQTSSFGSNDVWCSFFL